MQGFNTMKEVVKLYVDASKRKINMSISSLILKSIMAGALIGFGAGISSVAAHDISNVGIARLAAAVVFPVGLMMVILLEAELFTGDCLMLMSVFDKKHKIRECIRVLGCVYIGNFFGALLVALCINFSGQLDYSGGLLGAYTIKVETAKANISFGQGSVSGILCNILVCAAVLMAMCAKDVTAKLLVSFFVIMLFVTGGFEHCVANMYYISSGLIAKTNSEYVQISMKMYNMTKESINTLNIENFLIKNLLPVTIGNIIGGVLCVATPIYYLNKEK